MGINDREYARALQEQHMKAHLEYLEKQKEKEMAGVITSPQAGSIVYTSSVGTGTTWANNVSMTQSGSKVLDIEDLKSDAMQAPLSALVDMWTVRYGGTWVDEADFVEDDFWRLALIRLVGANKLEKHHLASQYSAVYRIIE